MGVCEGPETRQIPPILGLILMCRLCAIPSPDLGYSAQNPGLIAEKTRFQGIPASLPTCLPSHSYVPLMCTAPPLWAPTPPPMHSLQPVSNTSSRLRHHYQTSAMHAAQASSNANSGTNSLPVAVLLQIPSMSADEEARDPLLSPTWRMNEWVSAIESEDVPRPSFSRAGPAEFRRRGNTKIFSMAVSGIRVNDPRGPVAESCA